MEFTRQMEGQLVAHASEEKKAEFYKKTYLHVALAILAFMVVESVLLITAGDLIFNLLTSGKMVWLFVIGGIWVFLGR